MIILRDLDLFVTSAQDATTLLQKWLRTIDPLDRDKEHFIVLIMDVRLKVQVVDVVSVGILNGVLVHAREVYRRAVALGASKVVVAHNHPSSICSPSDEDRERTKKLRQAGEIIGIPLVDHIIFSESSFYSFADEGLL